MLVEVTIRNFALIDDLNLKFYKGLNIIMGETGSGKSNLIDSISVLMGERALKDKIRKGKDKAFISGVFDISKNTVLIDYLIENNLFDEDGGLVISREIFLKSSTVSKVNNIGVPSSVIREISKHLIDIYGQFENITILSKNEQRDFIDSLGGVEHQNVIGEFNIKYKKYLTKKEDLNRYKKSPEEVSRNLEFLMFQIEDIESSGVLTINEKELDDRLEIIENFQDLRDSVISIINILNKDQVNVLNGLGKIVSYSNEVSQIDNVFSKLSERLMQAFIELEDINREISYYFETLSIDEEEYIELDKKRGILFESKRKYGKSIEEIMIFYENAKNELNNINNYEENIQLLKNNIIILREELTHLAVIISNNRKRISKNLEKSIKNQLLDLEMSNTEFRVDISEIVMSNSGIDEVVFMISFNKNEPLKELSSVASGGEISRFMLAIKSIEAEVEKTPTIIFDEIDTGISGNAGNIVGNKLRDLSLNHQLLCISHLPQIISKGDKQFLVYKEETRGKITSNVKELDYENKIIELSKIIEGDDYSNHTYNTAKKMLDNNIRGD